MTTYNLGRVKGNGIRSIEKTATVDLVDTYTITFDDNTTFNFTVTNGEDGSGGTDIVTEWESTPSDTKIPSEKLVKDSLDEIETLIGNAIEYINM